MVASESQEACPLSKDGSSQHVGSARSTEAVIREIIATTHKILACNTTQETKNLYLEALALQDEYREKKRQIEDALAYVTSTVNSSKSTDLTYFNCLHPVTGMLGVSCWCMLLQESSR
jgi:hypothetical protein